MASVCIRIWAWELKSACERQCWHSLEPTSCQGDSSLLLGPLQLAIGSIINYYHSVNRLIIVGVTGLETLIRIYSGMLVLLLPSKVSSLNQQTMYRRQGKVLSYWVKGILRAKPSAAGVRKESVVKGLHVNEEVWG